MEFRIESDSIGSKQVPVDAYYGVQSLRGMENFQITGQRLRPEFIESLAEIKKACAICNLAIGELDYEIAGAIFQVCDEIVEMHGGTLTLENAPGGGTLVTVLLPATQ